MEDVDKIMVQLTDWLNEIEKNVERDLDEGPYNDLSEKKTALDKFKLFCADIVQHSEMVKRYNHL